MSGTSPFFGLVNIVPPETSEQLRSDWLHSKGSPISLSLPQYTFHALKREAFPCTHTVCTCPFPFPVKRVITFFCKDPLQWSINQWCCTPRHGGEHSMYCTNAHVFQACTTGLSSWNIDSILWYLIRFPSSPTRVNQKLLFRLLFAPKASVANASPIHPAFFPSILTRSMKQ